MQSYVISVSLGTGCYRHIQISADATLYKLHQAILKAFSFEDDHEHAFFMDNHVWSSADAYFSSKSQPGDRLTKKCSLKKLGLVKGWKFKYLFDFGDEWEFQCKVLRELDEKSKTPVVIRSVGASPEQYPAFEDEEDDAWFSMEMAPGEAETPVDSVPFSSEEKDNLRNYMNAAANLYGLIALDELYALYNSQNPKMDTVPFLTAVAVIDHTEDNPFLVLARTDDLPATVEEALQSLEIVSDLWLEDPAWNIKELRRMQKGKPLKILPKEEFLQFADPAYFPKTTQRSAMIQYLRQFSSLLPVSAEEYCSLIQSAIVIDAPLQAVLSRLIKDGLTSHKNWDLGDLSMLYQDLNNHTHKHANRGYTPKELCLLLGQGQKLKKQQSLPDQLCLFDETEPQP